MGQTEAELPIFRTQADLRDKKQRRIIILMSIDAEEMGWNLREWHRFFLQGERCQNVSAIPHTRRISMIDKRNKNADQPSTRRKGKAGIFVVVLVLAIIAAIFIGYNIWHIQTAPVDGRGGTEQRKGLNADSPK
ncbi:hypothetical protein [Novosphingobium lindaniclasticum]|uniref:hypothetical protein n=1 Tax=Novosphingobium lindaniclasticum TaxID=1329895 RepID=UPI002409D625|nr:hypothetical protein [Novosphingobium lindaniclasticum]